MTNLTSLPPRSRRVSMLTKVLVCITIFSVTLGAPPKEPSLLEAIKLPNCGFPPDNLKIPVECSKFTLKSEVKPDFDIKVNLLFYLCAALLDSKNRLCPLVLRNKDFGEKVAKDLNEAFPPLVCPEITSLLDPNTTMVPAKVFYDKMKPRYCVSICNGMDDDDSAVREPICRSIQFAHQEIRSAIALQSSLNRQAQSAEIDGNPAIQKPGSSIVNNANPSLEESGSPVGVQSNQNLGRPEESSVVQSGGSHLKAAADQLPGAGQAGADPALNPQPSSNSSKPTSRNTPAQGVAPLLHQEASGNEKGNSAKNVKPNSEPIEAQEKPEKGTDKLKEKEKSDTDGIQEPQGKAQGEAQGDAMGENQGEAQAEVQGEAQPETQGGENVGDAQEDLQNPPLTEDNDGTDDNMRSDDDDDPLPAVPDSNKDVAEKPPADERKPSDTNAPLISPQQKLAQGLVTGGLGNFEDPEDSHFFAYFMSLTALVVLGYLVYHNKRKIIAMAVEGKKGRNTGRRRPNSASYHKLDSNLEEAMSSNLASTNSYVIY